MEKNFTSSNSNQWKTQNIEYFYWLFCRIAAKDRDTFCLFPKTVWIFLMCDWMNTPDTIISQLKQIGVAMVNESKIKKALKVKAISKSNRSR